MQAQPQYLRRHAEREARAAELLGRYLPRYRHVLTIPAHAEPIEALGLLSDLERSDTLLIVVANDPQNAAARRQRQTQRFLAALRQRLGRPCGTYEAMRWWSREDLGVLCIERTSKTAPVRATEAVGMARKIAADLAVALQRRGLIASPIIHCTDADVRLPRDYFEQTTNWPAGCAAAVYAYRHVAPTRALRLAVLTYEIYLRSYVLGLARAGSPYAYHTLGSTIAIHMDSYMAVRGFPKRNSREDFYLLNKLAKIGAIARLSGEPLRILARCSQRVPIGTGQALARILEGNKPAQNAPWAYVALRTLLTQIRIAARAGVLPQAIGESAAPNFLKAMDHALACSSDPAVRLRHMHTWFDGLRTRQFMRNCSAQPATHTPLSCGTSYLEERESSLTSTCHALARSECVEASGLIGVPVLTTRTG